MVLHGGEQRITPAVRAQAGIQDFLGRCGAVRVGQWVQVDAAGDELEGVAGIAPEQPRRCLGDTDQGFDDGLQMTLYQGMKSLEGRAGWQRLAGMGQVQRLWPGVIAQLYPGVGKGKWQIALLEQIGGHHRCQEGAEIPFGPQRHQGQALIGFVPDLQVVDECAEILMLEEPVTRYVCTGMAAQLQLFTMLGKRTGEQRGKAGNHRLIRGPRIERGYRSEGLEV
ncbi:hypothetical protein D3C84_813140 [compost metagenome]